MKSALNERSGSLPLLETARMIYMSTENVKNEACRLLDRLPDDVTWYEIMHAIYVRQSIEAGLADSKSGKVSELTIDKTASS
mgnify:CR=1 FL=1|jgi:hypothetical protein